MENRQGIGKFWQETESVSRFGRPTVGNTISFSSLAHDS
jgi:hypothetical protein